MFSFVKGNIINSSKEAVVNTVNTVGVMGKGIALEFKQVYPQNYELYKKACAIGNVKIGQMLITETHLYENPKFIINFPTKKDYKHPSKLQYITEGLIDLKKRIIELNIKSIAIPPLGCGNGKLKWTEVKPLIIEALIDLQNIEVEIYEPSESAYTELAKAKKENLKIGLTTSRAMVLKLFDGYRILGYDLTRLEAQKLGYFLQRFGEDLRCNFVKERYGPYSKELDYLLDRIDGVYLMGMKKKNAKVFEHLNLIEEKIEEVNNYIVRNCIDSQKQRLIKLFNLIEGFESPLGMELLATVDFVILNNPQLVNHSDKITNLVHNWNQRKKEVMKKEFIDISLQRLLQFKDVLYPQI